MDSWPWLWITAGTSPWARKAASCFLTTVLCCNFNGTSKLVGTGFSLVFKRKDGLLFRKDYIRKTQAFYNRHGGKTIVIARFVAYIRTFAPIVAGMGKMQWQRFAFYNMFGGILWGVSLPLLGYAIGSS